MVELIGWERAGMTEERRGEERRCSVCRSGAGVIGVEAGCVLVGMGCVVR